MDASLKGEIIPLVKDDMLLRSATMGDLFEVTLISLNLSLRDWVWASSLEVTIRLKWAICSMCFLAGHNVHVETVPKCSTAVSVPHHALACGTSV